MQPLAALLHGRLHQAILQGVEGNHRQAPAGIEAVDGRGEHPLHGGELVVDGDADGLEAALGRVLLFPKRLGRPWPRG